MTALQIPNYEKFKVGEAVLQKWQAKRSTRTKKLVCVDTEKSPSLVDKKEKRELTTVGLL